MPAVNFALLDHNKQTGGQTFDDVILPEGDYAAYRKILGWILASIAEGYVVPFKKLYKEPLVMYARIKVIAIELGIGYLEKRMEDRIQKLAARQG